MRRIKEEFLNNVERIVSLQGKQVLEVGCGVGGRSIEIAARCKHLEAIDPSPASIAEAKETNAAPNIVYKQGSAEKLEFGNKIFDMAIFTLSLHHVPLEKMGDAISEAIRVVRSGGYIIFLEPASEGSFFEAEIKFDACDGDERMQKAHAYYKILSEKNYHEVSEISDETVFQFDSLDDFVLSMEPKRNIEALTDFLKNHNFILNAQRRISIFRVS